MALVAQGRSNREISDALTIALTTAERHVHNILTKLECSNRAAAAAIAATEMAARATPPDRLRAASRLAGGESDAWQLGDEGIFVGRRAELGRLVGALDRACEGQGRVVSLAGEPGIGKTALTRQFESVALERGAVMAIGETHESGLAPPYWPWLLIGRELRADDSRYVARLGLTNDEARELSRMIRLQRDPARATVVAADTELGQFRLWNGFTRFILALADVQPVVVALEDIHWADRPSLQLLEHLAAEIGGARVLLLVTYRDSEVSRQSALNDALATIGRTVSLERIVLGGLSRDETGEYVEAMIHAEPGEGVVDQIFAKTEGHAFYVREMVTLLADGRALREGRLPDRIPDGIRETLGRRLNRLSPATNEVLQVAAVSGREFRYGVLAALTGKDGDELLAIIEEALDARIIEELREPGQYRFSHALLQETLANEISVTRRCRLHGTIGAALETLLGDRADEYGAELASHYMNATALGADYAEGVAHYAEIAQRDAESLYAWDDAARFWTARTEALERLSRFEELGLELNDAGRLADAGAIDYASAARHLKRALALHERLGDVQGAAISHARLGRVHSTGYAPSLMDFDTARGHYQEAIAALEPMETSAELVTTLSFLVTAEWNALRVDEGLAAAEQAERRAREMGTPELGRWSRAFRAGLLAEAGQLVAAGELFAQSWAEAAAARDAVLAHLAHGNGSNLHSHYLLDFPGVMEWCARARAFGDFGERRMVDVNLNEQWALLEMGARRPPSATRHRQPLGGDFELNAHAATSMMSARFRGGAWEDTSEHLDELVRKLLGKGAVKAALMAVPMLTRALGRLGRIEKQFEVFERARTYLTPSAHGEALALDSEFAVALAASGRFQEASEVLGRLDVARDGSDWRGREALVLLASSLVAAGAADPAASMLFERARSTFQQYRLPWYEAEGLEDWAGAMLESGQQDAAREAAAEALAIYGSVGAPARWLQRAEALQQRVTAAK